MITQWIWDSPFSEPFQPTGLTGGYGWWPNDCWFQSGEDVMQEYSGNDQRFGDHRFRYSSFSHLFTKRLQKVFVVGFAAVGHSCFAASLPLPWQLKSSDADVSS